MIGKIFADLYKAYGDQQWWSTYTPFEKMIAALFIQHTSHTYSQVAMAQLKQYIQHGIVTPEALQQTNETQLTQWIQQADPDQAADIAHAKAQQIKRYSQWYVDQGGFDVLNTLDMLALRNALLTPDGMDKEIADLILLYAFERPVFIIDDDMRRIFYRLEIINGDEPHDELRHIMALSLDQDATLFNEFHALLAHHAQAHCRYEAQCDDCPLDKICPK